MKNLEIYLGLFILVVAVVAIMVNCDSLDKRIEMLEYRIDRFEVFIQAN